MTILTVDEQKENARNWIAALRSGKFEQGIGHLHDRYTNEFCCLGVACKVLEAPVYEEKSHKVMYGDKDDYSAILLPLIIADKIGLKTGAASKLANMNDEGETFEHIADSLEKNPEIYFLWEKF